MSDESEKRAADQAKRVEIVAQRDELRRIAGQHRAQAAVVEVAAALLTKKLGECQALGREGRTALRAATRAQAKVARAKARELARTKTAGEATGAA